MIIKRRYEDEAKHIEEETKAARRLNCGCGLHPMLYWTNLDADSKAFADIYQEIPPLPFPNGALDDIYAGHFLEHLSPDVAQEFLQEAYRCLAPGGRIGIVVPDTREIMTRYLRGDTDCVEYPQGIFRPLYDLDSINALFLYSTVQESPHLWMYDSRTLTMRLKDAGFFHISEIDRWQDPRIAMPAWYQFGYDAYKPQ